MEIDDTIYWNNHPDDKIKKIARFHSFYIPSNEMSILE